MYTGQWLTTYKEKNPETEIVATTVLITNLMSLSADLGSQEEVLLPARANQLQVVVMHVRMYTHANVHACTHTHTQF